MCCALPMYNIFNVQYIACFLTLTRRFNCYIKMHFTREMWFCSLFKINQTFCLWQMNTFSYYDRLQRGCSTWQKQRIPQEHWSVTINILIQSSSSFFVIFVPQLKLMQINFNAFSNRMCEIVGRRFIKFWAHADFIYRWTDLYKVQQKHCDNINILTSRVSESHSGLIHWAQLNLEHWTLSRRIWPYEHLTLNRWQRLNMFCGRLRTNIFIFQGKCCFFTQIYTGKKCQKLHKIDFDSFWICAIKTPLAHITWVIYLSVICNTLYMIITYNMKASIHYL